MTIYNVKDDSGLLGVYTNATEAAQFAIEQDTKMQDGVRITDENDRELAKLRLERVEVEQKTFPYSDSFREQKTLDCSHEFREELGEDVYRFDKTADRERTARLAQEREHADRGSEVEIEGHTAAPLLGDYLRGLQDDKDKLTQMFGLDEGQGRERANEQEAAEAPSGFASWLAEKKQEQEAREQQEPAKLETVLHQGHDYGHDFSHGA